MESSGISGIRFLLLLLVSAVLNVAAMGAAHAAIRLDPVLDGLSTPVYITNAHYDSNRLFIVIVANYRGDATNNASTSTAPSQAITEVGNSSNVALASAGALASASSSFNALHPVASVIDNDRAGLNAGNGGVWADATPDAWPDSVQINFNGSKTIDQVVVYSLQDNYTQPMEPTDSQTFSLYGIKDFTVEGRSGGTWVTLATVSNNTLVKRTVTFAAFTTDAVRVVITNALASYSRITEIEAWGVAAASLPATNTALSTSGTPAVQGARVTFTATVTGTGATPTGSINFTDGGTSINGCNPVVLSGGSATCSTSILAVGSHTIVANYSGDAGNAPSASSPLTQVITGNGLMLTLSGTVYADNGTPLAGVRFDASAAQFSCPDSDSTGHYFCTVPQGWSGTVTPTLAGYEFTPSQRAYDNVTADETQDFLGTPH